ncbi:zinc finger CCCH domain-containing protein 48-like [Euphorbia lathyris]|uniref:zinc finger CCCH domain-containing protein 48-like n=1 Tax=Euphorbia lathyris TaxID=212925 RepID=UPI0033140F16
MSDDCVTGDGCQFCVHGFCGDWFSLLVQLKGHTKAICGIALPSRLDKPYSRSNDGMVHVWDSHTGQPTKTINLGEKIGCLIGEGSWIFVGFLDSIKDGSIFAWEGRNDNLKPFNVVASLKCHTVALTCLTVGRKRLY